MTIEQPRRAYEHWDHDEDDALVAELRAGLAVAEIADRHGRSVGAINGRCRDLLPSSGIGNIKAPNALRTLLADPGYDWREVPRARAQRLRSVYWEPVKDAALTEGWAQHRDMDELITATGASEIEVASRLIALNLAGDAAEVAARLRCDPSGTLARRLRIADFRATGGLWVLVVDGARGASKVTPSDAAAGPAHRHMSIHVSPEEADDALYRVLVGHVDRGGTADELRVTLALRTAGEGEAGFTHHEIAPSLPVDLDR